MTKLTENFMRNFKKETIQCHCLSCNDDYIFTYRINICYLCSWDKFSKENKQFFEDGNVVLHSKIDFRNKWYFWKRGSLFLLLYTLIIFSTYHYFWTRAEIFACFGFACGSILPSLSGFIADYIY